MCNRISGEKHNNGEIMLEGLLVVIVTMFLLLFVIAMFSYLFFRWNIQTAANDTAARYAQSYSYIAYGGNVSLDTGKPAMVGDISIDPYRYIFLHSPEKTTAIDYANDRLRKSTAGFAIGSPKIDIKIISDIIGRRHVEVKITGNYKVLMQDVFAIKIFRLDRVFSYEVYGYADCVDLLDYLNTVNYIEWVANDALNSKVVDLLNNIIELVGKFF